MKIFINNKQLNVFWGTTGSLFQQFMELRKSLRTNYEKEKASYEIKKSNLSLEISSI
jgi:hypothetical protein